jgi:thiamine pyrophosphokinase
VVIFGAFGGRLDQEAQNINTLYNDGYRAAFGQIVLLSDECVASLLQPGE